MELLNKVAIVTGASGGLGTEIVTALLKKGSKVYCLDLKYTPDFSIKEEGRLTEVYCNVLDKKSIQDVLGKIIETESKIDILVNCAGIIFNSPVVKLGSSKFERHSEEDWDRILQLNLSSVFYVSSQVIEKMVSKRTKGVIVNISSIMAQGNMGQSVYSASKAGVEALTLTWAKELGIFGIRAFCVSPGFIGTESTSVALSDQAIQDWKSLTPVRRLGKSQEIAHGVIFGIENDFFNGKVLPLDGGLTF